MQVIEIPANRAEKYCDTRLEIDFRAKTVVLDREPVRLTHMEFQVLTILAQNAGEIVPRSALLANVWGYGPEIRTRTLDVHIRRLRGKLKDYSRKHIETIFGIGFRLEPCRSQNVFSNAAAG
jgi:two-component system phosphate regulon response regulator PhoB